MRKGNEADELTTCGSDNPVSPDELETLRNRFRWAQDSQTLAIRILAILNRRIEGADAVREILEMVKELAGFEAVGIRLRNGEDFPYFATIGFPVRFVAAENLLCTRTDTGDVVRGSDGAPLLECLCGTVIARRTDPAFPCFTEGGSFWTNSTSELICSIREADLPTGLRNRCHIEGYESVALIPLVSNGGHIGLLQLNDSRRNRFTPDMITFLEGIGAGIGIVLARFRAEKRLQSASTYNRSLIEASLDPLVTISAEGKITDVNTATELITGYPRDLLIGTDFSHYFTDPQVARAGFERAFRGDSLNDYELGIRHKNGQVTPVMYNATVYRDESGRIAGVFAAARDITVAKRAEAIMMARLRLVDYAASHSLDELLQATLDEAETLTDSAIGFYHFVDADQKSLCLQAWSAKTLRNMCTAEGKGLHYVVDKAGVWTDCVHKRRPVIHNDYSALPHRKGMPAGHAEVVRELVVPVFRGDRIVAILGVGNKPVNYGASDVETVSLLADLAWDITERKRAEIDREGLIRELATKNAELERFAYTVSHDLKSPLITIKSFAGFIEEAAETGDFENFSSDLERISKAAEKMGQLLDDILELSRIGRMVNPPSEMPVADLVTEVLELLSGRITESAVEVIIAPDLPIVRGDRPRLREVLQNLIENAVKFMGDQTQPRIEIRARDDGREIIFSVRDNGTGIDRKFQDRVFRLFDKLDQKSEGTGIGLALVKRIVDAHGGRIWVESEGPGKGSTFSFSLPHIEQTL